VRTAFPTTGGFDEGVTLFCLHPSENSSRTFHRFLPEIADDRSVYAPDLPGCGESDPAPSMNLKDAAAAVADLAEICGCVRSTFWDFASVQERPWNSPARDPNWFAVSCWSLRLPSMDCR